VPPAAWLTSVVMAPVAATMMASRLPPLGPALMLPLVMAVSFAGYVVMTRHLQGETLRANLFYTAAGVFVALTPFMPGHWLMPTAADALVLAGIGGVGLLALLALDRATACGPISGAIPALYVHLPALALVSWAMGGEFPSRRVVAGALVIAGLLAWMVWRMPARSGRWVNT